MDCLQTSLHSPSLIMSYTLCILATFTEWLNASPLSFATSAVPSPTPITFLTRELYPSSESPVFFSITIYFPRGVYAFLGVRGDERQGKSLVCLALLDTRHCLAIALRIFNYTYKSLNPHIYLKSNENVKQEKKKTKILYFQQRRTRTAQEQGTHCTALVEIFNCCLVA